MLYPGITRNRYNPILTEQPLIYLPNNEEEHNMSQEFGTPNFPTSQETPKKSNTGKTIAIIVAILLLLCCCCAGVSYYLYNNGDSIMRSLGLY